MLRRPGIDDVLMDEGGVAQAHGPCHQLVALPPLLFDRDYSGLSA
jgi:hypothetical protein